MPWNSKPGDLRPAAGVLARGQIEAMGREHAPDQAARSRAFFLQSSCFGHRIPRSGFVFDVIETARLRDPLPKPPLPWLAWGALGAGADRFPGSARRRPFVGLGRSFRAARGRCAQIALARPARAKIDRKRNSL